MLNPILLLLAAALAQPALAQSVRVDGGTVRGTAQDGGAMFRGIPFAAPPVERLRWQAPQPVVPWTGVRDVSAPAPACLQNDEGWNRADFLSAREDCLTLDVRTPAMTGRRPVLVWIHGGGNRAGSPGDTVTSGVGKEIVLVAVRYRLGIFGFLSHRALTAEQGASGNYGIMDQAAALEWVQRNIARFGGDPGNVTLAGESAGAQDVGLLLAAPRARTLFHKAILQSGTPGFGLDFRSLEEAHRIGDQADDLLGGRGDLKRLRAVSTPALLEVDRKLHDAGAPDDAYMWLRTTIDGRVFERSPQEHLAGAPPRPVIIGTNRFELDLPGGRPNRDAVVARAFGANEPRARALYELDRPEGPADPRLGSRDQTIATDVTFRCPAIRMAELLAARGAPVFHYEFDVAPNGARTWHAAEIGYAFGDQNFAGGLSLKPYWLQFARTGDPNSVGLPQWPRFTAQAPAHIAFTNEGATSRGALRPEVCSLLKRI